MEIEVQATGWGLARPADIRILLANVADHMNRYLRSPFTGTILIRPSPHDQSYPKVFYRANCQEPFIVQLSAQDRKWSQFSYQFAHEFCHILSGYERLRNNPNNWFHEAICELASVFTLRQMAETWTNHPPFPLWSDYASSLSDYAENLLSSDDWKLPESVTLPDWLSERELELRKDPRQRELNAVVAYSMLPLLEDYPIGWNAIVELPDSTGCFAAYLNDWHARVDGGDRRFLESAIGLLLGNPN